MLPVKMLEYMLFLQKQFNNQVNGALELNQEEMNTLKILKNQGDDYKTFLLIFVELNIMNFCKLARVSMRKIIWVFCVVFEMKLFVNNLSCGKNSWVLYNDNEISQKCHYYWWIFGSTNLIYHNIFLFPLLELPLRDHRFESIEAIIEYSLRTLKGFHGSEFKECFKDWNKRSQKCIAAGRDYVEEDVITI